MNSFAKKWTKLMGLNSHGCAASGVLGSRIMWAEFRRCRLREVDCSSALIALIMSELITGQHFLKNNAVYPSIPGALSEGISMIAALTSSAVNCAS